MVFTLVSSTTQPFDVNRIKLESIIKIISAQSDLVHYERVVRSSQFMDCEDVNDGRLSSFCTVISAVFMQHGLDACLGEVMAATASGSGSLSFWFVVFSVAFWQCKFVFSHTL